MEITFIRHGQGEHTLSLPESFQLEDPSLTEAGREQARSLSSVFDVTKDDLVVASPTRRTLQTASLIAGESGCRRVVHPLVSPRMFPQKPGAVTVPCDRMLDLKTIRNEFPDFEVKFGMDPDMWASGINVMPHDEFSEWADTFLRWIEDQGAHHVYVVSHDGTITAYRERLRRETLSRADFLNDAGWIREQYGQ
ncbi:histidine phosphatase family protein [Rossellomorea marisflavi]|uniref:histidine phosphatase family protein n=1 Tax=Rossellomorea marisflavi TaxID=189381 RepID=UPI003AE8C63F